MKSKFEEKKEKFLKEKRRCKCGCNKLIPWKDYYFKNRWPIYIQNHRKKTLREIRKCGCGCGQTFECIITSNQKYIGHHRKGKLKKREIRKCGCGCGQTFECTFLSHKKYIKNHKKDFKEIRKCGCGCGQTFECYKKSNKKYIGWHKKRKLKKREIRKCGCGCGQTFKCTFLSHKKYIKNHHKKKLIKAKEKRKCLCGCGQTFECKKTSKKKYIKNHHQKITSMKGKTYEEIYGIEKAKKRKIMMSKQRIGKKLKRIKGSYKKGKTYEEIHGEKKAQEIRKKYKIKRLKWTEKNIIKAYVNIPNIRRSEWNNYRHKGLLPDYNLVRERIGSIDKLVEITNKPFLKPIRQKNWGIGKDEKQILDYYEKKIGNKIERNYEVNTLYGRYFLDGYDVKNKIPYEVDESHHKYQIVKDKIRENNIITKLNCNAFVRFDQIKERKKLKLN